MVRFVVEFLVLFEEGMVVEGSEAVGGFFYGKKISVTLGAKPRLFDLAL